MTTITIEESTLTIIPGQAPFRDAAAAMSFTFRFSGQNYERPLMNRLASKSASAGASDLVGLDGAAQAGLIRGILSRLPVHHQAVLVSRFAPHSFPCSCGRLCCSHSMPNLEWQGNVRLVADRAEHEALAGCTTHRKLTLSLLARLFGESVDIAQAARRANVAENTALNHHSRLKTWLRGERAARAGESPKQGAEQYAMNAAEALLIERGIVGDDA